MAKLKLKINVNLLQLLCIFVSVALHGEFERFCRFSGFALTVTIHYKKETKGGKLIFDRYSAKPIFTQKLRSPGFQIEHQIN